MKNVISAISNWLDRPWRCAGLIFVIYFLSSFFASTLDVVGPPIPGIPAVQYNEEQWVTMGPPRVLRGDECHYLMVAHSLAGDFDLILDDEYAEVLEGGPQMGAYFSGKLMELPWVHTVMNRDGKLIGKHPIGLSVFLAIFLWPLADSGWMEPAAIWLTALVGAIGVAYFIRCLLALKVAWPLARTAGLLLAFGTPWFSYSRTLLTEIYLGTGFLMALDGVLRNQVWRSMPAALLIAWVKYPALLLFFGAGTGEAIFKRWRNFFLIGTLGAACLFSTHLFNKYMYTGQSYKYTVPVQPTPEEEIENRMRRMTAGTRATTDATAKVISAPIAWVPAQDPLGNIRDALIDKKKGLLQPTPILFFGVWGMIGLARANRRAFYAFLIMLLPFFLLHLFYEFLLTGTNYSLRYMVPCIPLLLLPLPWFMERRKKISHTIFRVAVVWSLLMNILAGVLPATSFRVGPRDMLRALWDIITALFGFGPA